MRAKWDKYAIMFLVCVNIPCGDPHKALITWNKILDKTAFLMCLLQSRRWGNAARTEQSAPLSHGCSSFLHAAVDSFSQVFLSLQFTEFDFRDTVLHYVISLSGTDAWKLQQACKPEHPLRLKWCTIKCFESRRHKRSLQTTLQLIMWVCLLIISGLS